MRSMREFCWIARVGLKFEGIVQLQSGGGQRPQKERRSTGPSKSLIGCRWSRCWTDGLRLGNQCGLRGLRNDQ